ncbi:hypothetical protein DES40_0606 [Litorimonas taeanensis]|uniref:Uncharacterized protein n=1 Tax=Litorimonas taeanensis TaxID=568099 RepID=A0A420WJU0_9PROT|nr:hypothetical protein [Litorimonas taeanensis]RKQ71293.1 hypothetical protein DES40_0606 [Litorimonas taeanensis]
MSDISKKILSIDPEQGEKSVRPTTSASHDVSQSPSDKSLNNHDVIPSFVTKPSRHTLTETSDPINKALLWTGLVLSVLWITACLCYLFLLKNIELAEIPPIQWGELSIMLFFPAALIYLFFLACHKLKQFSVKADKLSRTSLSLLQADENASMQTRNLAETIRHEISKLDKAMNQATSRLDTLRDTSKQHTDLIDEKTSALLSINESVKADMQEQKSILDDITQVTEARLTNLSSHLKTQQANFSEITTQSADKLVKVNTEMAGTLSQFEVFTQSVEARVIQATESLKSVEANAEKTLLALTEKSENLQSLVNMLTERNQSLETIMEGHFETLSELNYKNEKANALFAETLSKSLQASQSLKEDMLAHQEQVDAKKQALEAKHKSQETQLADSLSKARNSLAQIEAKLSQLEDGTRNIEGQKLAQAETHTLPFSTTRSLDVNPPSLAGGRVHLKPLDTELPSDNESYYGEMEGDISIPDSHEDLLDLATTTPDLVRPIDEPQSGFGKKKKKEKSAWRWRDLMGGFDGIDIDQETTDYNNIEITETNIEKLDHAPASELKPSFEKWLSDLGIDGQTIVTDGTVLDVSDAIASSPDTSQSLLEERLTGVVDHFRSISQDNPYFKTSAQNLCAEFEETLNPQIMNKQAIRARLGTPEGKIYLLARLVD